MLCSADVACLVAHGLDRLEHPSRILHPPRYQSPRLGDLVGECLERLTSAGMFWVTEGVVKHSVPECTSS